MARSHLLPPGAELDLIEFERPAELPAFLSDLAQDPNADVRPPPARTSRAARVGVLPLAAGARPGRVPRHCCPYCARVHR